MDSNKLVINSLLSIAARVLNAIIQIVCLPVLLLVFGKSNYGLIVIAMSLNTFIAIIQLGIPTGLPKFVSEWLAINNYKQLHSAIRTISSFYIIVALINLFVLISIAAFWPDVFKIAPDQIDTLKSLLIITAITSFMAIPATVLDQLLTGAHELGFVSKLEIVKNVLFAGLVVFIYFQPKQLSITQFYALRCVLMFVMVPFKIFRWKRYVTIDSFLPGWDYKAVMPLIKYCSSLMTFSVFIYLADKLRPIILGIQMSKDAGIALADYQIINYIRIFLLMFASSLMTALIPHISSIAIKGDSTIYKKIIQQGTKYVWTFSALLGFGIILLSKEALWIYVGQENLYLNRWLILMVTGTLYNLYVSPIASVILSSSKLKPMILATVIGCIVSLGVCWILTPRYGIGSIPISLIIYNIINLLITHLWYLPRYFDLNPFNQFFKIMLPPIIAGVAMCMITRWIIDKINFESIYANIGIGVIIGTIVYMTIIMKFYLEPKRIWEPFRKLKAKNVEK